MAKNGASRRVVVNVDEVTFGVEIPLVKRALAEGKPVMGICRGHQVITVAAGGSLYRTSPWIWISATTRKCTGCASRPGRGYPRGWE